MKRQTTVPKFISRIPGHITNARPSKQEISDLFYDLETGWTSDGFLEFHHTEIKESFQLVVSPARFGGFLLVFRTLTSSADQECFSHDASKTLTKYVRLDDISFTLEGLLIEAESAILAICDFLDQEGHKSERITWITDAYIPTGMHWVISEDVLEEDN